MGQNPYEGIWLLKDDPTYQVYDPLKVNQNPYIWYWTDSNVVADTVTYFPVYYSCPHIIKWNQYDMVLVYGDINDPNTPIIAKKYSYRSFSDSCVFYYNGQTATYLATWVKDHFVSYCNTVEGISYEKIDSEVFSQQQLDILNPKEEEWIMFQYRPEVKDCYRCTMAKN